MATPEAYLAYDGGNAEFAKKFAAGGALDAGDVVLVGNRCGVVSGSKPIAAGDDYTIQMTGVFNVKSKAADTPADGAIMYWDDTNKEATTTASTNKSIGLSVGGKAASATRSLIDLNASVGSATI